MAEAVGFVSAGVGIASFAVQVSSSIGAWKATYQYNREKAPQEVEDLTSHLEFVRLFLDHIQPYGGNPLVGHAIRSCRSVYNDVEKTIQLLLEKINPVTVTRKSDWKAVKFLLSGQVRKQIEDIEMKLLRVTLLLNVSRCALLPIPPETPQSNNINPQTLPNVLSNPLEVPPSTENVTSQEISAALSRPRDRRVMQKTSCAVRLCHCSCHMTENSRGRYWGLEYTPLSLILGHCDYDKCDMKRVQCRFRLAFNRIRVPWALLMDFESMLGSGKCSIRPALSLKRVVNYTSPGFEIMWRCENHLMPLADTLSQLRDLDKLPSPLQQHVNPDGENYVQALLCHGPWSDQTRQFELLAFFVEESGIEIENEDSKFLTRCVSWIGEGRHLDLLDTMLQLGFDPSGMNSPLFQQWPWPCSPNWRSEELTPDPFFHEYLAALVKKNPGFGGSTPLQDAVLCGETAIVQRLLPMATDSDSHRNFLGQTPLHLAVCNLEISTLLLDAGHDINTTDRWGITPLMYAAALGVSEVVQLLIIRGANIMTRATNWNRDFMHYASVRGHWDLILESLYTIRHKSICTIPLRYREEIHQILLRKLSYIWWLKILGLVTQRLSITRASLRLARM
ncbi:hypothetical protein PMG11_03088 [Penicillium brasilianum]|uniref:protein S-acyltransferase n=1 Tax=Penicillium brasilianum TaxID=104259 RepID=A0A0F7V8Z4_PENBI|nr:hypothetical protein PMG11_03088 [Penicillium brasilianum]